METYPLSVERRSYYIETLLFYGLKKELIVADDMIYTRNRLLDIMDTDEFICPYDDGDEVLFSRKVKDIDLADILDILLDDANSRELFSPNTTLQRDLFDTKIMDCLMPRPSEVCERFFYLYKTENAEAASDYFYNLSQDSNYIRKDRIVKDMKWKGSSKYGDLDITINLSKPEKDPRDIAKARTTISNSYPKCPLCKDAVGYRGRDNYPARQNHRTIPLELNSEFYYFQYSPYVYYNEHCIVFNSEHRPMCISENTFKALFDFIELFPHYFIGSNADLPIVGGSILSHDHFQGGRYSFPMDEASELKTFTFEKFPNVELALLKWPLTSLRLKSENRKDITDLADLIQRKWRKYSDESFNIFATTSSNGEELEHNTVTPIARRRGRNYELDIVLRNNRTDEEHPLGIFHPHSDKHHIKKENIGLIEVMGLAVLPARIKDEIELLKEAYKGNISYDDDRIAKHKEWFDNLISNKINIDKQKLEKLGDEDLDELIRQGIASVFEAVLEDCAVFPLTEVGISGVTEFIQSCGGTER